MSDAVDTEWAMAWANARKRADETVIISACPCCKTTLAVYVAQSSKVETVPYAIDASLEPQPSKDDTSDNSR